jgi:hypothetical protein
MAALSLLSLTPLPFQNHLYDPDGLGDVGYACLDVAVACGYAASYVHSPLKMSLPFGFVYFVLDCFDRNDLALDEVALDCFDWDEVALDYYYALFLFLGYGNEALVALTERNALCVEPPLHQREKIVVALKAALFLVF